MCPLGDLRCQSLSLGTDDDVLVFLRSATPSWAENSSLASAGTFCRARSCPKWTARRLAKVDGLEAGPYLQQTCAPRCSQPSSLPAAWADVQREGPAG